MSYALIKSRHPELTDCFFAFSKQQFEEGVVEHHLEGKKLYDGGHGLVGTKEGIQKLFDDYAAIDKEVSEKCAPQEVYDYEFNNHECGYTNDDSEPLAIVERIFGERVSEVTRKYGQRG
jgi:hypothetical protein